MAIRTRIFALLGTAVILATAAACSVATADTPTTAPAAPSASKSTAPGPTVAPTPESAPAEAPAPTPAPAPVVLTYLVVDVIDGDTIDIADGAGVVSRVRHNGIDAPEMDTCEGPAARDAMVGLVLGKAVRLTLGGDGEDKDKYDRLLRYVDTDTTDSGLAMINAGFAIARYDSRDGYGLHDREAAYVAADASSPDYSARPRLRPPSPRPPSSSFPSPARTRRGTRIRTTTGSGSRTGTHGSGARADSGPGPRARPGTGTCTPPRSSRAQRLRSVRQLRCRSCGRSRSPLHRSAGIRAQARSRQGRRGLRVAEPDRTEHTGGGGTGMSNDDSTKC